MTNVTDDLPGGRRYDDFLKSKAVSFKAAGIKISDSDIHPKLFPFQRDLTRWALAKGCSAIFADTGLGKTFMQLEWARLLDCITLIVAPLTVARQTVWEGAKLGLDVSHVRDQNQLQGKLNITNYEMLDHFDPSAFGAVVLDESSILKSLTGKTRKKLIEMFAKTPYRLCCTATPAPNDIAEIANHAEFLGIMRRVDMLATFFVHDDKGWRLRGHATEHFYRWLASWGISVKKPSDLGYDDDDFILPELRISPHFVPTDYCPPGQLFFTKLRGIQDRSRVRRATINERVAQAIELVNSDQNQWIIWCGLNDEQTGIMANLNDQAVSVYGSLSSDSKAERIEAFQNGDHRVLVSKPRICGFGMNFQHCHKMIFLGLSDSWESYYQCVRRCWRYGQKNPVDAHIILSEIEDAIWHNIQAKEKRAEEMTRNLIENVQQFEMEELMGTPTNDWEYDTATIENDRWKMMLGDSVERMAEIEDESVGLSVFSPPFLSLYTYTPSERDLGNARNPDQFFEHFAYIIDELLRVTMPGRICAVHCADVGATLAHDGFIGLKDFPGHVISAFVGHGWIYHGRVTIDKNPQAQAIRTHAKALLFKQKDKDSSWLRPALADYIVLFRKPGENPEPVNCDLTNDEWVEWAHPIWYGIRESDTLQYRHVRDHKDDRHICPLQLPTILRCIRLWSNPCDLICDPFAGIGSSGYVGVIHDRRFVGIELKRLYYEAAVENLQEAERKREEIAHPLFNMMAAP